MRYFALSLTFLHEKYMIKLFHIYILTRNVLNFLKQNIFILQNKLTRNIHMKYKNSGPYCSKVNSKAKVVKNRSNSKVKVTGLKMFVPTDRSCHKKYAYEKPKLCYFLLQQKLLATLKVSKISSNSKV